MMKIAIIAGGSGLVGTQLLHQLFKQEQYDRVISVGRRELAIKHAKLVQVQVDFNQISKVNLDDKLREKDIGGLNHSLLTALNADEVTIHAYCSLGTTIKKAGSKENFLKIDHDFVIAFARWVQQLGASKFLYVSSIGADAQSSMYYSQVKGKVEEDLKRIPFEYLGLFQPSILLGNRRENRIGEDVGKVVMRAVTFLGLFKKYKPIYDSQVAKAMLFCAASDKKGIETISSTEMQELKL